MTGGGIDDPDDLLPLRCWNCGTPHSVHDRIRKSASAAGTSVLLRKEKICCRFATRTMLSVYEIMQDSLHGSFEYSIRDFCEICAHS
jgi:DNA-directed RNA polymerase subunit N (RpoN/RPB10)